MLSELLPKFEISSLDRPLNLGQVLEVDFVVVDFGAGMGIHSLDLAATSSKVGVLAIDVHTVGLLAIAETATDRDLRNIRTHHGDGIDVIKSWLEPNSIDELHILFPDPWPKARHNKRRLVRNEFLRMADGVLKPGGRIIFATDDESYFESVKLEFDAIVEFEVSLDDWDVPLTAYHKRALRLGNKISQLTAQKI